VFTVCGLTIAKHQGAVNDFLKIFERYSEFFTGRVLPTKVAFDQEVPEAFEGIPEAQTSS